MAAGDRGDPQAAAKTTCEEALARDESSTAACTEACHGRAPEACLRSAEKELAHGDLDDARMQFIQACSSDAGDLCARGGDRLAPVDPHAALRLYADGCRAGSTAEANVRSCLAAGELVMAQGQVGGAIRLFTIACKQQAKNGPACALVARVEDANKKLIAPVSFDAKVIANDGSTWTVELDKPLYLATETDAWLGQRVIRPSGTTLSDTLGKRGEFLTFSATTITQVDGAKVTLKKRATVPFVRATRKNAGGSAQTRDIPLGAIGASVQLTTLRASTVRPADVASWWTQGGPYPR